MKVVIVGGAGLIGSAIAKELGSRYEIVVVGRKTGTIQMDSTDAASIRAGFQKKSVEGAQTGQVYRVV